MKIRARHQGTKNIFVHNDLFNAASHFKGVIERRAAVDDRKGIAFDRMACMLILSFAIEATANFFGERFITPWDERQPTKDKLKALLKQFGLRPDWSKHPWSSVTRLKEFRDSIVHGKPITEDFDEEVLGDAEQMDRPEILDHKWVSYCSQESVLETYDDVGAIWDAAGRVRPAPSRNRYAGLWIVDLY